MFATNVWNFGYHKKLSNDNFRWKCTNQSYKTYIKLDVHQNLISDPTLHTHNPDDNTQLNRQKLKLSADQIITFTANDVNLVRKNIYNTRRSILLKIPLNKDDVGTQRITRHFFYFLIKKLKHTLKHLTEECSKRALIFSH
ncbi:Uncharacterized protein FWK35_00017442 [Aphis craccivora]|uniref:FLYWCH-type domain-containing protein n=1 Tax=Aphis craccivora TaxID=307492 RepID=A0A6G0YXU8_APHCR|nr:Uncharacterized protein FWK35_00017442 [Aphis craccivora]